MIVGDVRRPLLVLLGAVGFVLLVACANVANLLLARGSARHGELAVRAALGAGRARLVRQLITEAMVLGLVGGVLGLMLAYWGTEALIAARPADMPRLDEIGLDGTVALFTLGAALLTGLVVRHGAGAAGHQRTLDARVAGERARRRRRPRRPSPALGTGRGEMALAVILLTGSGLLIRSFVELTRVHPGFRAARRDGGPRDVSGRDVSAAASRSGIASTRSKTACARCPASPAVAAGTVLPLGGARRAARLRRRRRAAAAARREPGNRRRQRDAGLLPRDRHAAASAGGSSRRSITRRRRRWP